MENIQTIADPDREGLVMPVYLPGELLAGLERDDNPHVPPECVEIARSIVREGSLPVRGFWNGRHDRPMFSSGDLLAEALRRFRAAQATT